MASAWTLGLEIELLAPPGSSRLTLAEAIADLHQGCVTRFFHPQSEPSPMANTPVLENLTLGFEVVDHGGEIIARCVDDLTLQADCCKQSPPAPGWYRIVSDDPRLLHLVRQVSRATDPLEAVLDPVAKLFGVDPIQGPGGMVKVCCEEGWPIAVAAPLPGERERPCELISAPFLRSQLSGVEKWLETARDLHFTAPLEGATHLHIDATSFCSPGVFRNLMTLVGSHGGTLRRLFRTNPRCRKLGAIPDSLMKTVQSDDWQALDWDQAREILQQLNPSKYLDFNFRNMIFQVPHKHTIEVRILPVWLEFEPLVMAIDLLQAMFELSLEPQLPEPLTETTEVSTFLNQLPLSNSTRTYWLSQAPSEKQAI